MTAIAAELAEVKSLLRGILISSPRSMTIDQLQRDFKNLEGRDVPYRNLGHASFLAFLQSVPDTVMVQASMFGPPIVVPVQSEKTLHVDALVQKQKIAAPKRGLRIPVRRRTSVGVPVESSRNKIIVPHHLQQEISKYLQENSKGVSIEDFEKKFFPGRTLYDFGVPEGNICYVFGYLDHILRVSKGLVYPLSDKPPVYKPTFQQEHSLSYIRSRLSNEHIKSSNFIPSGSESDFVPIHRHKDSLEEELEITVEKEERTSELYNRIGEGDNAGNFDTASSPVPTSMVPNVPSKVKYNIEKIVIPYPSGLDKDLFVSLYEPCESFPQLYPSEVVGPRGYIPYQKIPPETTKGSLLEVLVTEVYTPANFWVQLRGEQTHLALNKLMDEIQDFYQQEEKHFCMPDSTIRIGQYCMAPYNEEWHRANITAVHNLIEVQVMYVDYGTSSRVKKKELRFMHQDFATLPIQAIKASLANIIPAGDAKKWPRSVSVRFLHMVAEKPLFAVVSSVDHEAHKLEVALVDTSGADDVHINDVLERDGLAQFMTSRQPQPPSPPVQRIAVDHSLPSVTVGRPPPGFTSEPKDMNKQPLSATSSQETSSAQDLQNQTYPHLPQSQSYTPLQTPQSTLNQAAYVLQQSAYMNPASMFSTSLIPQTVPIQQQAAIYEQLLSQQFLQNMLLNPLTLPFFWNQLAVNSIRPLGGMSTLPSQMFYPTQSNTDAGGIPSPISPEVDISEISPTSTEMPSARNPDQNWTVVSESHSAQPIIELPASPLPTQAAMTESTKWSEVQTTSTRKYSVADTMKNEEVDQLTDWISQSINDQTAAKSPVGSTNVGLMNLVTSNLSAEQQSNKLPSGSNWSEISDSLLGDTQIVSQTTAPNQPEDYITFSSDESDFIYRSDDDEDENTEEIPPQPEAHESSELSVQEIQPPRIRQEPNFVKKLEIAKRMVHLVNLSHTAFLIVDEVVRLFTDFSGRHVVLKILDAKGFKLPLREIERRHNIKVFEALDGLDVVGVPKNFNGAIMGNVNLIPLESVNTLLTMLNIRDRNIFRALEEEVQKFDPSDEYWTGS